MFHFNTIYLHIYFQTPFPFEALASTIAVSFIMSSCCTSHYIHISAPVRSSDSEFFKTSSSNVPWVCFSPQGPGKWVWRGPAHLSARSHRRGRQHGKHAYHGVTGSGSTPPLSFLSTRAHRGRKHEWGALHPSTIRPHSLTTKAHRGPPSCTWDTPAHRCQLGPCPPSHCVLFPCGSPSYGSRARGRS